MTIQDARRNIIHSVKQIYSESEAGNIADLLLEHISGLGKTETTIKKDFNLDGTQISRIKEAEKRLLAHEPIQYIINEAWFYGLKFYVDKNVLIPRPETEELIEWIISNLKFPIDTLKILDIGSGSGCISIALKRKLRKAEIWSCDVSKDALRVARYNAESLGANINFIELDFLVAAGRDNLTLFDIIVSNPPYVPEKDMAQMNRNVLNYEPHPALFVPDNDPLVFYRAIAEFGKNHLAENGSVFLELHENFASETAKLFRDNNYKTEIKKDMQGKERMLHANLR